MGASAEVILDSISPERVRLTTFQVTCHRFVLAELNTHRAFSRNSASSRAIPVDTQIKKLLAETAVPLEFGTNQPGMQAGPPLDGTMLDTADNIWKDAALSAVGYARALGDKEGTNVHKQVTNRLLEPFMWHTAIITSVDYDNFFAQRCSPLAQPEIQAVAYAMRTAYEDSDPQRLEYGEWHTPYIREDEWDMGQSMKKQVSAARCARVSYLTQEGVRDVMKDVEMYQRLIAADPPHWSPLEHVATPLTEDHEPWGNFVEWNGYVTGYQPYGWAQLRHNPEPA